MRPCLPPGLLKFWGMLKDGRLAAREQSVLFSYLTLKPFPSQTQYDLRRPDPQLFLTRQRSSSEGARHGTNAVLRREEMYTAS